jgi:hypothetical protein
MIPPTLHFIWISRDKLFGQGQYHALRTAIRNTSYQVVLHTNLLETDATEDDSNPYTLLGLDDKFIIKHQEFRTDLPVSAASLSDLYRLEILHSEGGIYSDLDIIWLRDIDVDMSVKLFGAWENQSYKCAVNGLFGMEKGYDGIPELVTNLIGEIKRRKKINHWIFFKPTTLFIKSHADVMLPQKMFFRNGWRRIGRLLQHEGVELSEELTSQLGKAAPQKLRFDHIVGFHWYGYYFKWSDIVARLPATLLA